jgi:hypothetical protein
VAITRELVGGRMFPLTLDGLDRAMRALKRSGGTRTPEQNHDTEHPL